MTPSNLWILQALGSLEAIGTVVTAALERVDRNFAKQAGPLRLVGVGGILEPFDPARDSAWSSRHSIAADGQIPDLRGVGAAHQGLLEQRLGDLFQRVEDAAKASPPHKDPAKSFAGLYRWASTLYLRLAGTALGETPNIDSITDYLRLLEKPLHPIQAAGQQTTLRELMKGAARDGQAATLAPGFKTNLAPLQPKPVGARDRSSTPRWPANDRLSLHVSAGATAGTMVLLTATTFIDTWRKNVLEVAEWNIAPAMENLMRAWRDDFIVTEGQYRNLQVMEFAAKPALEFEFISPSEVQVRPK